MKTKFTSEYRVFRRKITLRIACLALLSIGAVFLFYRFIWYEKAGEWVLALLRFLGMNQHEAFEFLHLVLRQNRFFIMGFAVICVFCIFLRFLFVSFIRYLDNVNQGIDKLLTDDNEPLHLLPEYTRYILQHEKTLFFLDFKLKPSYNHIVNPILSFDFCYHRR